MNIKTKWWITSLVLLGCISLQATTKAQNSIVFKKFVEPHVNRSLYLDINGEASISIALLVDDKGVVDDWLTLRTNDKVLIQSIRHVIDEWVFEPAMVNGEPSWAFYEFTVDFRNSGSIISITPTEVVMSLFNTLKDDFKLIVPFHELDEIPKPISIKNPVIHASLKANNSGKSLKMEFYIDETGAVRMPVVIESSVEKNVAAILMDSLMTWKFEAPVRNGRKVGTKAIVPFTIN